MIKRSLYKCRVHVQINKTGKLIVRQLLCSYIYMSLQTSLDRVLTKHSITTIRLNLTNQMITSLISSSRKRDIDISSLEPTGALVWDTVTERLWLRAILYHVT